MTMSIIELLRQVASDYRRLGQDHLREGTRGTTRRRLAQEMRRVARRFDRLLAHWVADEALRAAWLRHLRAGAPAPDEPRLASAPPLFRGATDAGAIVDVRAAADGGYDIHVDGALVRHERVPWHLDPALVEPVEILQHACREVFAAPEAAVRALAAFARTPGAEPPWEWGRELVEDGLVSLDFAMTPRGQRRLAALVRIGELRAGLRFCVLVADSARARILVVDSGDGSLEPTLSALTEVATLTSPERRARDSELFSDPRPGLRREGPHGPRHGMDDHRAGERREARRRFAELAAAEAEAVCRRTGASRLVVAAGPGMLGFLRRPLDRRAGASPLALGELARDLSKLAPPAIHDALAHAGLLPPRGRRHPAGLARPGT
jgi:protein required for attachment to host cells